MKENNKRGFTLIELLAVIVILAIIALIATPIILNMITKARKNAAKSSALGYIDAIEYYAGFNQISDGTDGYNTDLPEMTDGKVKCEKTSSGWNDKCSAFFAAVDTKTKGAKPDTATIYISSNGKVLENTVLVYNSYEVSYDGQEATTGGKPSSSEPEPTPTVQWDNYKTATQTSGSTLPAGSQFWIQEMNNGEKEACALINGTAVCASNDSNGRLDQFSKVNGVWTASGYISQKKAELEAKGLTCVIRGNYAGQPYLNCEDSSTYFGIDSDSGVSCFTSSYDHGCNLYPNGSSDCS